MHIEKTVSLQKGDLDQSQCIEMQRRYSVLK